MQSKDELINIKNKILSVDLRKNEVIEYLKTLSEKDNNVAECKQLLSLETQIYDEVFNNQLKIIDEIITLNNNYSDFNIQYMTFKFNYFNNLGMNCEKILGIDSKAYNFYRTFSREFSLLFNYIRDNTKHKLFDLFKYGNKNYVLFGKNGAGKTTLLKKLSTELLNSNALVIPATRDIKYDENPWFHQSEINLNNAITSVDQGKSLFFLGKCIVNKEMEELRAGIVPKMTITQKIIDIFSNLGLDRELLIESNGTFFLYDANINKYSISNASDGERSVIYIISATLLAPENAYIFIDEPENHLNGALMRKLFSILENSRPDIKFIFATHNIPFIECQKNVELVYLEKNEKANDWSFKKYGEYVELPLDIILNVEGTNDDVIFCEGEDKNSFDCKLYEVLFPKYQIIPSNGCENVINKTRIFNSFSRELRKNGYGIVDNDFNFDEHYCQKLKDSKITILSVNEVENLFLLEDCLIKMKDFIGCDKSIEEIENYIISIIVKKIPTIKKDYATKLYRNIQKKNKIDDITNIQQCIETINNDNTNNFLTLYKEFEEKLNNAITNQDYNCLMQIVPGKVLINEVAKYFGLLTGDIYKTNIIRLICKDNDIKESLRHFVKLAI